ncbi:MAG: cadmium-translocating P-type ATPase, partial [Clostridiales bacterium]|nr:cadmium-translocating P-type ATPase [Clostridiales bacterium]
MKKMLYRILAGAAILAAAVISKMMISNLNGNIELGLFLVSYFIIGGDVVKRAVKNITKGQMLDENFLMSLATVGAFFVGDYAEAVSVMLFYQVGELFQSYAVNKSRKSIAELMDIRPDYAWIMEAGNLIQVSPEDVAVGQEIFVKPGEKIPLDGVILNGYTSLDTVALTGESVPREAAVNDIVMSGCVNLTGAITIKVTKIFSESTVSKILDLVENAANKKAEAENFITKFARYYTPCVVGGAVLLAVIPPLVLGGGWSEWIYRALTFLVISCPCALVISIPLSFFGGIGGAGKAGILVKGGNYLEALAHAEIVVMDKTGTLTKGNFKVTRINPANTHITKEELLKLAAYGEAHSNHPISVSLKEAYGQPVNLADVGEIQEIAGHGIVVTVFNQELFIGNDKLMKQKEIQFEEIQSMGTVIYVAKTGEYLGSIEISDELKEDAKEAIDSMKKAGVSQIIMLTGDKKEVASQVASKLGITQYFAELLPTDKVERVEEFLKQTSPKGKLVFVGDGINDAPVLARADIGIAMGGLGSDAAIEAADIVIMTDEPSK